MSIKLSPLFSDGMVLQRGTVITVRGFCNPDETVSVCFAGTSSSAKADGDGAFTCELGSFTASCEPRELEVSTSNGETLTVHDVLVGDVWLCSGQSNMEMTFGHTNHFYPEELTKTNTLIRQFRVPQVYNFREASDEFGLNDCKWELFNPDTAPGFMSVGYFFAKKLHERYDVPVGLFAAAVGGTPVSAWLNADMLADLGLTEELEELGKCKDEKYIEETESEHAAYVADYHKRLDEADAGLRENWESPDYDDSDWDEIPFTDYVEHGSGAYWYRRTLEIPAEMQGQQATIFLGTAIDMDDVYINGQKLGTTYYRYPPREYSFTLPHDSKLVIAIRLLCFNGYGGFTEGKNYFIATDKRVIDIGGGAWKHRLGTGIENQKPQTIFNYKPTGMYNGVLMPLSKYCIKGIIWYQGESDTGNPERYAEKLTALIKDWRRLFGADTPFIQTQLVHYALTGKTDWNPLREQQKRVLTLSDTGLALTYDLGEANDLHPQNKRDVGERLARIALRLAYGEVLPPNQFEMYML